jgi:hypothetical protein
MMQWLQTAFHWAPFSLSILLGIQLAIFVSAEETAGMIHGHLLERANRKNNQRAVKAASTARLAGRQPVIPKRGRRRLDGDKQPSNQIGQKKIHGTH